MKRGLQGHSDSAPPPKKRKFNPKETSTESSISPDVSNLGRFKPGQIVYEDDDFQFEFLYNDQQENHLIALCDLKQIFAACLPRMGTRYVTRHVFDEHHRLVCCRIKSNNLNCNNNNNNINDTNITYPIKYRIIGGICIRPFYEQHFGEVVFLAVHNQYQHKSVGRKIMRIMKHVAIKENLHHFYTYADNQAIGFFQKMGFIKKKTSINRTNKHNQFILCSNSNSNNKNNNNNKKEEYKQENGYELIDKEIRIHSTGGCFQEINIYKYFNIILGNLWCLWELSLTGQPLLVLGSSSNECSNVVLGIMSLISPITYHGDFRPYFTIYDDDFKHFCNLHDRDMLPPLILGVTNPFFLKVMPKFPHILILSSNISNITTHITGNIRIEEDSIDNDIIKTIHVKTTNTDENKTCRPNVQKYISNNISSKTNTIISKSTPCLFPDEQVLSRLLTISKITTSSGSLKDKNNIQKFKEKEIKQICILNNAILRKYFQHLTDKFLEPFQEYFTFKVPSGMWNPYLNPPQLKIFERDNFLNIIRDIPKSFLNEIPLRTSTLPTGKRSVLVKLYSKFLKSPHFPSWFNKKRERAKRKCDKIIYKMIKKIKFEKLVEGKPVREGIKMYQTIHRHMNNNNQSQKPKVDLNDVLIKHRAILRSALPTQIIEALDLQVEKMREEQIKKRKEWQIKYQKHLKQQRVVYNLEQPSDQS